MTFHFESLSFFRYTEIPTWNWLADVIIDGQIDGFSSGGCVWIVAVGEEKQTLCIIFSYTLALVLVQRGLCHYVAFCRETHGLESCCLGSSAKHGTVLWQAVVIHHAPFSVIVHATQARYSCLSGGVFLVELSLRIITPVVTSRPPGCFPFQSSFRVFFRYNDGLTASSYYFCVDFWLDSWPSVPLFPCVSFIGSACRNPPHPAADSPQHNGACTPGHAFVVGSTAEAAAAGHFLAKSSQ